MAANTIAVHPIITMLKTHTLSVAYRNKIVMYGGYGRLELPVPAKSEPAPWMNAPAITKSVTAYATNVMMPKTTTDPRIAVIGDLWTYLIQTAAQIVALN